MRSRWSKASVGVRQCPACFIALHVRPAHVSATCERLRTGSPAGVAWQRNWVDGPGLRSRPRSSTEINNFEKLAGAEANPPPCQAMLAHDLSHVRVGLRCRLDGPFACGRHGPLAGQEAKRTPRASGKYRPPEHSRTYRRGWHSVAPAETSAVRSRDPRLGTCNKHRRLPQLLPLAGICRNQACRGAQVQLGVEETPLRGRAVRLFRQRQCDLLARKVTKTENVHFFVKSTSKLTPTTPLREGWCAGGLPGWSGRFRPRGPLRAGTA